MFCKLVIFGCFSAIVTASYQKHPGFSIVDIVWPQFNRKCVNDVKRELRKIIPDAKFRTFSPMTHMTHSAEEFFAGKIKLVVNEKNLVVEPPRFWGEIPEAEAAFVEKVKWGLVKYVA